MSNFYLFNITEDGFLFKDGEQDGNKCILISLDILKEGRVIYNDNRTYEYDEIINTFNGHIIEEWITGDYERFLNDKKQNETEETIQDLLENFNKNSSR